MRGEYRLCKEDLSNIAHKLKAIQSNADKLWEVEEGFEDEYIKKSEH
jgi:hypothetical protein